MKLITVGPAHPWLVQTYAEVIPYPCCSILGQELFQSGAIPSDTDYRIFKEFGGDLPGKKQVQPPTRCVHCFFNSLGQ